MTPRARKQNLRVESVAGDLIVYDRARNRVHRLNPTTALVWRHCDGHTSTTDLTLLLTSELGLPADERLVWMALRQLDKAGLLIEHVQPPGEAARMSRREAIALGITGAVALLLPACDSATTPTLAGGPTLAAVDVQGDPCKSGGCVAEVVKGHCACKPKPEGCGKRKGESGDCRCFAVPGAIGCNCICAPPDDQCDPTITVIGVIAGLDELKQGTVGLYRVVGFAGNCGTCQHVRCKRMISCEWEVSDKTLARVNALPDCKAQLGAIRPGNVVLTATLTLKCTGSLLTCSASTSQAIIKTVNINV